MRIYAVERLVLLQQCQGALGADPSHAGNIVGRITHQSLEFDDLSRGDPFFFVKIRLCQTFQVAYAALCHADAHVFIDQLVAVSVARIDQRFRFGESVGDGSDQVVRFKSGFFKNTDVHGGEQIFEDGDLDDKIFRHRLSCCLVAGIHLMAECGSMYVERHNKVTGIFVFDDFEKKFDKSENTVGRKPVFCGKDAHRIVSAIQETVAVNENEFVHAAIVACFAHFCKKNKKITCFF